MTTDLADILPEEFWTPMSTIMKAFDRFLDCPSVDEASVQDGGLTGTVLESTGATLAVRTLPPVVSEEQGTLAVSWRSITEQLIEPWDGEAVLKGK
jgi:hypothetical protein